MAESVLGNSTSNTAGSVNFKCPKCQKAAIVRTQNERQIVARYTCPECGFMGPN